MSKYVAKRIGMMVFVVFGVILFVFIILYFTPGDSARMLMGPTATDEEVIAMRLKMGLDDPFLVRFGKYLYNLIFKFDLGTSYRTKLPVMQEIATRFPTTLKLGLLGLAVSLTIGISAGIVSSVKQYTAWDSAGNILAVIFASMPSFWLALELSIIFALNLRWLPATGYTSFKNLIMPMIAIGIPGAAPIFRMTRSSMLEVVRSDFVRTARAKGQSEFKVIMHHALHNALIPVITMIGNSLGGIVAGAVVIENIFSIPGLGSYMMSAINARDYPVIQGGVLVMAVFISFATLLTDIMYAYIDPQIKSQFQAFGGNKGLLRIFTSKTKLDEA